MKLSILALAAAAAWLWFPIASGAKAPADKGRAPVTVFVLRHAEALEASAEQRDPELSELGAKRAGALARLLSEAGVGHLYSSPLRRARATLEPLAKARELALEEYPPQEIEPLAAKLRALAPGAVAVVAGHSNTVPSIVKALGGTIEGLEQDPRHGPVLAHDEHDRLFVVTLPALEGAAAKTIELRCGE